MYRCKIVNERILLLFYNVTICSLYYMRTPAADCSFLRNCSSLAFCAFQYLYPANPSNTVKDMIVTTKVQDSVMLPRPISIIEGLCGAELGTGVGERGAGTGVGTGEGLVVWLRLMGKY